MANPIFILFIGILIVVGGIIGFKLHPVLALLLSALVVAVLTPLASVEQFFLSKGMSATEALLQSHKSIGERIAIEFGNTCAKVGILIAMAAIIGKSMLDSGAAEKIIRAILKITGEKKAPVGFVLSSFFLTIPVFVDAVSKSNGNAVGKKLFVTRFICYCWCGNGELLCATFAGSFIFSRGNE